MRTSWRPAAVGEGVDGAREVAPPRRLGQHGVAPAGVGAVAEDEHGQGAALVVAAVEGGAQGQAGVGPLAVGPAGRRRVEVGHVAAEADEHRLDPRLLAQPAELGGRLLQVAQQRLPARRVAVLVGDAHAGGRIDDDVEDGGVLVAPGAGEGGSQHDEQGEEEGQQAEGQDGDDAPRGSAGNADVGPDGDAEQHQDQQGEALRAQLRLGPGADRVGEEHGLTPYGPLGGRMRFATASSTRCNAESVSLPTERTISVPFAVKSFPGRA